MTPICPLSLSFRPILFPDNVLITIKVLLLNKNLALLISLLLDREMEDFYLLMVKEKLKLVVIILFKYQLLSIMFNVI